MAYDFNSPFYNFGEEPFWSSNAFRFNTGGASPPLRYAASQLMNGNAGTTMANLYSQQANRQAAQGYQNFRNAAMAGGQGGNYNLLAGGANTLYGGARDQAMKAYGQGAEVNQRGMYEGGQLSSEADKLDQAGKDASLRYLASLRPEQFNGFNEYLQNQYQQNEGFLPALGKGLLTGGLAGLTGGLGAGLLSSMFPNVFSRGQNVNDDSNYG